MAPPPGSWSIGRRSPTGAILHRPTRSRSGAPAPIGFAYGPELSGGDGGFLTVGAENVSGNRGANYYFDGGGTAPTAGSQLVVTSTAGEAAPPTNISFDVVGRTPGAWSSRAEVQSPVIAGSNVVIVEGTVRAR